MGLRGDSGASSRQGGSPLESTPYTSTGRAERVLGTPHTEQQGLLVSEPKATPSDRSRDVAGESPALGHPPTSIDPDWRERIEIAKRVREEARKARGDKPATFDLQAFPIRIRQ